MAELTYLAGYRNILQRQSFTARVLFRTVTSAFAYIGKYSY